MGNPTWAPARELAAARITLRCQQFRSSCQFPNDWSLWSLSFIYQRAEGCWGAEPLPTKLGPNWKRCYILTASPNPIPFSIHISYRGHTHTRAHVCVCFKGCKPEGKSLSLWIDVQHCLLFAICIFNFNFWEQHCKANWVRTWTTPRTLNESRKSIFPWGAEFLDWAILHF